MSAIKFGVCGLGRIGVVHCRHFTDERERYRLVACCDRDAARVDSVVGQYGGTGYTDFAAFLADAEMELAIIATRSLDHVANAGQALAAGKTVLLEKPIAVTTADYEKLRELDAAYPGKLFFLHNHRFEPAFQNIRDIVRSGILGDLQVVKLYRHFPFRRRGDWQALLSCGGGQLSVWGPHVIDHALQYLGAPVKEVWSYLRRVVNPGDADDHVRIIIVAENDAVAELEISNSVPLPAPYCTVYGSRGALVCADEKTIQLRYIDPEHELPAITASADQPPRVGGYGTDEAIPWIETSVPVQPETNMWVQVEIDTARHLYDAIRRGVPFPVKNSEALEVVRVTEMVKQQNPQFAWTQ